MDLDIVIIWVDGNDPKWRNQYNKYANQASGDKSDVRFRDFELLKYWFRGIEKYASWVRKIHFVTCGHYPEWLDINHEKINFVKHEDFIPSEYLPTFNSHTIELNLHRIEALSENFIYFNDDFFVVNKISKNHFFNLENETPKDCLIFNPIIPGGISHIVMNNIEVIKKHYSKKQILRKNFKKVFNLKYGVDLFRSLFLMPWPDLVGFKDTHLPVAFKKSTYVRLWQLEYDILNDTCLSRFRDNNNVSQYLIRYFQLSEGKFEPKNMIRNSKYLDIGKDSIESIIKAIETQKSNILVINDSNISNFELTKFRLQSSFNKILPNKSQYERIEGHDV